MTTIKNQKPPWLSDTIKALIQTRDKAFKIYRRTNRMDHRNFNKQLPNKIKITIKNEKRGIC